MLRDLYVRLSAQTGVRLKNKIQFFNILIITCALSAQSGVIMKIIENINRNNFQSFGTLLELEGDETNFEILVKEEVKPWRLAVFRV